MVMLDFSLSPDATHRVYELLLCLAKFGENVSLEARKEKVKAICSHVNSYHFGDAARGNSGERFTCQLLNRALQIVFKGRAADARGRDISIDRCDVSIREHSDQTECRLVAKIHSKQGLTKTYRLTYESAELVHALFDKSTAAQGWQISSRVLREYVEYFGAKTEQLDIFAQEGKAIFTSFTEKIQDGKEVLKQPLETAVAIHTEDFEDFHMQESMHMVISVKDFRAIVTHAETIQCRIQAYFSYPTKPLQFSYQNFGMLCEFTLMTTGDLRAATSAQPATFVSTRATSRPPSVAPTQPEVRPSTEMPPPPPGRLAGARSLSNTGQRSSFRDQPILGQGQSSSREDHNSDSLFVPNDDGDEDRTWDPVDYDQQEDEMLGWDATNDPPEASFRATVQDKAPSQLSRSRSRAEPQASDIGLPPTQRLSELHGLFD